MSEHDDVEASLKLNVPQLAILLIVGILAVRWIFSSSGNSTATQGNGRPMARGFRVDPRHVDAVAQMFPQLSRRDIMWDLHRNGGNIQMTIERLLAGRSLETPPQSFQPILPPPPTPPPSSRPSQSSTSAKSPPGPNLIQRYNLESKVSVPETSEASENSMKPGWSNSKSERQNLLQKRREEMILQARRKMMDKEAVKSKS